MQALEKRNQMIAEAAYYRAERRGFQGGDPAADWFEAEAEIDRSFLQPPGRDEEVGADTKAALEHRLEAQLAEWDTQIDELMAQAQYASGELRAEYDQHLKALAKKRTIATDKLEELHHRTENAWKDLQESISRAWADLSEEFERVAKDLLPKKAR